MRIGIADKHFARPLSMQLLEHASFTLGSRLDRFTAVCYRGDQKVKGGRKELILFIMN